MSDAERAEDAARLRDLETRLSRLTKTDDGPKPMASHDQAHLAWRMVIELVAGLGIGFGVGFGLDKLFGTTPFLLVIFLFLGLAAGVKTMMRTAAELQRKSGSAPGTGNPPADLADDDEDERD
ncbi:AtpZ/AtpI family protein [Paracoccus sp. M683]|uniref:AtpZ/AtpI family protein n=1 Tax=Paracoccus sp. M683 TaxID=2594268 RepID=UPI00117E787B|nr:AtpZ/AtpI family protein [Paracoccus sp. M683]TRW97680.1 AtpZ/AtpI family protein [Paracoccus sp. M683]